MRKRAVSLLLLGIFAFGGCVSDTNNNNLDILDDDKPRITLYGDTDIHIPLGTNRVVENDRFIAEDKQDGDLTNSVKRTNNIDFTKAGTYTVTYFVEDSDGYNDTKTRRVIIEDNSYSNNDNLVVGGNGTPTITLYGDTDIHIPLGTNRVLENDSFIATDREDGDLTNRVQRTNDIDFSRAGTYTVTYSVVDSDGHSDTQTRTVTIDNNSYSNNNNNNNNGGGNSDIGTSINGDGYTSALDDFESWYYNTCGESFNRALYNESTGKYRGTIECSNKGLDYIDLSKLSIFTAINKIDLSHNNLTDIDFSPIRDIQGLNYLYINNNTAQLKRKYNTEAKRKALFRFFTNIHGGNGKNGLFIGFKPNQNNRSIDNFRIIF